MTDNINTVTAKNINLTRISDCTSLDAEELNQLENQIPSAELSILLGEEPRPQFHQTDKESYVIILRGINDSDEDKAENMVSVRIANHKNQLYVAHKRRVKSLTETLKKADEFKSSTEFVLHIADKLTDKIESHIFALEEEVDNLEENMLDAPNQEGRLQIMQDRRKVIELRKYLLPQREVLMQFSRNSLKHIDDKTRNHFIDLYQRTSRICDLLDALRERLSLIQEEITAIISDKMNKNVYILSIVSAIFLPLGYLTGLLGINVGGMPGADNPIAFWLVCGISIIFGVSILLFFKRKKWI